MDEQIKNNDEIEIDLMEIFHLLVGKIWIIGACFIVGALLAGIGTKLFITPQYSATSMIYILSKTTSITSVADIQMGAQLTVDFETLATTRPVLERVIEDAELDIDYEELMEKVTVENPESTQILKMTVEDKSPTKARDISNAWSEATAERVAEIMVTDKPTIAEEAVKPKNPSSPSLLKNIAIGALLGLLLSLAVIIVRFLLDDTVKTEEDVKKYLNMNTLAAIPIQDDSSKDKKPVKHKKKLNSKSTKIGKKR